MLKPTRATSAFVFIFGQVFLHEKPSHYTRVWIVSVLESLDTNVC